MPNLAPNQACVCESGQKYKRCCRPLHRGDPAPTPLALMRSRYSAFAGGLAAYLVDTTDPDGPQAEADRERWLRELEASCRGTRFLGLRILEHGVDPDGEGGWVHFHASLSRGEQQTSLQERSRFVRRGGRWLYHSGEIQ